MSRFALALAVFAFSWLGRSAAAQVALVETNVPEWLEKEYEFHAERLAKGLPGRDLKVKTLPLAKVKFTRPDPKLLENKFIATLVLRAGAVDPADGNAVFQHQQRTSSLQGFSDQGSALAAEFHSEGLSTMQVFFPQNSRRGETSAAKLPAHFHWLAERSPPEALPEKGIVAYLASPDCARDVVRSGRPIQLGEFTSNLTETVFQVHARTEEDAVERAKAIVRLYDAGFSRPAQQHLLTELQKSIALARDKFGKIPPVDAAMAAEKEKMAKPTEITTDILKELKAQKVMVAVELAGLNARVKACDAMLQEPGNLRAAALQSVGDMKVKAEVERVGIKEKLDAINAFIAEGNARDEARRKFSQLEQQRNNLVSEAHEVVQTANRYLQVLKLYEPFEIPDNQITVAPLEWTE
jgi:hypothetical protein